MVKRTRIFDLSLPPELNLRAQRGFTYAALLIYLAIVSGAFAAIVSTGTTAQRREKEIELLYIGEQFRKAFKSYYDATPPGQNSYPSTLQALLKDPRFPTPKRYLRRIPLDPITGTVNWGQKAAPGGGIFGVYSMSDRQPIIIHSAVVSATSLGHQPKYSEWVFGYLRRP